MSPEQARAARNWLTWTQAELAERAKVGLSTVKDYESGKRVPIANNMLALKAALEAGGVDFQLVSVAGPRTEGDRIVMSKTFEGDTKEHAEKLCAQWKLVNPSATIIAETHPATWYVTTGGSRKAGPTFITVRYEVPTAPPSVAELD